MTTNGGKLSAIARRRLRDAQSATVTPLPIVPPTVEKSSSQPTSGKSTPRSRTDEDSAEFAESENQFKPLIETGAVHFGSTREVEAVGQSSIKIKFSRSQKCFILGICDLWVKEGSVFIFGATLHASTSLHRVYAPRTHALVSIEAITKYAEFELQSVNDSILDVPSLSSKSIWTPLEPNSSSTSFYILGHSFEHDTKSINRVKELSLDQWKPHLMQLSTISPDEFRRSRILLCGKRLSGLSTFLRCLVNRILTISNEHPSAGVAKTVTILDLDSSGPEYAAPGMISLTHVVQPMFGPSFTHPLSVGGSTSRILKQHFLGEVETSEMGRCQVDQITDLLDLDHSLQKILKSDSLIILAPKWWNNIDQDVAAKLWKEINPTTIACLDMNPVSPHLRPWRNFANTNETPIIHIPPQVLEGSLPMQDHNQRMQSYFHAVRLMDETVLWDHRPVLAGGQSEIQLKYAGSGTKIIGIALVGTYVAVEDTFDALQGSIAAIVAVNQNDNECVSVNGRNLDVELDNLDSLQRRIWPETVRTEEGLPRFLTSQGSYHAGHAPQAKCIGLGFISRIDILSQHIMIVTGLTTHGLNEQMQGLQVALVVQKATSDGRYKTDWMRREMTFPGREQTDMKGSMEPVS